MLIHTYWIGQQSLSYLLFLTETRRDETSFWRRIKNLSLLCEYPTAASKLPGLKYFEEKINNTPLSDNNLNL